MASIKKHIFIFFGPPGSGKGSLCQKIVDLNKHVNHISIGNLCRKYAAQDDCFGKEIKSLIENGNLIPFDNIVYILNDCLREFSLEQEYDVLLQDGFPRNNEQALFLIELYKKFAECFSFHFLFLDAEESILRDRMKMRLVCSKTDCEKIYSQKSFESSEVCVCCSSALFQRKDDMPEVIEKRLAYYFFQKKLIFDILKEHYFIFSTFNTNKLFDDLIVEFEYFFKSNNLSIVLK
jgi:adenylate kinase